MRLVGEQEATGVDWCRKTLRIALIFGLGFLAKACTKGLLEVFQDQGIAETEV